MNDANFTKIYNRLNIYFDCAGIGAEQVLKPVIKKSQDGASYYVDVCIEDYDEEQLAYLVGYLAEFVGMKNIWFDTYPKSGRATLELVFPEESLKRMLVVTY